MKIDHQQVIVKIDDAHDLSIVSIDGKPEIAILGPEGVMHDTVEFFSNVKGLIRYLNKYFGVTNVELEIRKNEEIPF